MTNEAQSKTGGIAQARRRILWPGVCGAKGTRAGFTLIEVIISMAILLTALLSLSSLQTASIGANTGSQYMTVATTLAQDKLEILRSMPYDEPAARPVTISGADNNPINADGMPDPNALFSRAWTQQYDNPSEHMKLVTVSVSYPFRGSSLSVVLSTIVSKE